MTADEVWNSLVGRILDDGLVVQPRGLMCKEILSSTTVVDMSRPITTSRPKLGFRFMAAEAYWILAGRNDVQWIKTYSPHIAKFSNDGIKFDGAYGPRIVDQLRYVCDSLEDDWQSRQAVIEIWRPNPRPSKDIPCTISAQWMIRPRFDPLHGTSEVYELHCFDTMRSSDAWLGWPYDVFNFSMLSAYIALMLRQRGGQDQLTTLKLGNLHLTAASQHLYVDNPNIPYTWNDVEHAAFHGQRTKDYEPLDLYEFKSPQDFLDHMGACADLEGVDHRWLAEFQK